MKMRSGSSRALGDECGGPDTLGPHWLPICSCSHLSPTVSRLSSYCPVENPISWK